MCAVQGFELGVGGHGQSHGRNVRVHDTERNPPASPHNLHHPLCVALPGPPWTQHERASDPRPIWYYPMCHYSGGLAPSKRPLTESELPTSLSAVRPRGILTAVA